MLKGLCDSHVKYRVKEQKYILVYFRYGETYSRHDITYLIPYQYIQHFLTECLYNKIKVITKAHWKKNITWD